MDAMRSVMLTLWRTDEVRTRSEIHAGVSGRGGQAGDRGWPVSSLGGSFVGDVEQVAGELGISRPQGPGDGQANADAAGVGAGGRAEPAAAGEREAEAREGNPKKSGSVLCQGVD